MELIHSQFRTFKKGFTFGPEPNVEYESVFERLYSEGKIDNEIYEQNKLSASLPSILLIDSEDEQKHYSLKDYPTCFLEFSDITRRGDDGEILPLEGMGLYHFKESQVHESFIGSSMIKFANKYGSLRQRIGVNIRSEHFDQWFESSERLSEILFLWDAIKSENLDRLNVFIKKSNNIFKYFKPAYYHSWNEREYYPSEGIEIDAESLKEAAIYWVASIVNRRTKECNSTYLVPNDSGGCDLYNTPAKLIDGIWIQAAKYIAEGLEFRRCVECTDFFQVKAAKRKNEKIYCSDKCRVRAGARKRRAQQNANKGKK